MKRKPVRQPDPYVAAPWRGMCSEAMLLGMSYPPGTRQFGGHIRSLRRMLTAAEIDHKRATARREGTAPLFGVHG